MDISSIFYFIAYVLVLDGLPTFEWNYIS